MNLNLTLSPLKLQPAILHWEAAGAGARKLRSSAAPQLGARGALAGVGAPVALPDLLVLPPTRARLRAAPRTSSAPRQPPAPPPSARVSSRLASLGWSMHDESHGSYFTFLPPDLFAGLMPAVHSGGSEESESEEESEEECPKISYKKDYLVLPGGGYGDWQVYRITCARTAKGKKVDIVMADEAAQAPRLPPCTPSPHATSSAARRAASPPCDTCPPLPAPPRPTPPRPAPPRPRPTPTPSNRRHAGARARRQHSHSPPTEGSQGHALERAARHSHPSPREDSRGHARPPPLAPPPRAGSKGHARAAANRTPRQQKARRGTRARRDFLCASIYGGAQINRQCV